MNISTLGIDLAKSSFQLHGVDKNAVAVLRRKMSRLQMLEFVRKLPICTIVMEACGSSNYWGRKFREIGHEVKLISPQFVKPFVKSQKNDSNDAEAIVEAALRPSMRFVPIKEVWQQNLQALHRVRTRLIRDRTALSNQIRGFLREHGVGFQEGFSELKRQVPLLVEDAETDLSNDLRDLLSFLWQEFLALEDRIKFISNKIETIADTNEICQRLQQMPGVGPLVATGFIAQVGNVKEFKNGRSLSAWMGLVPRQHSSGGKNILLGITKRGDPYLRMLLVHGARGVVNAAKRKQKDDPRSRWMLTLLEKKGHNRTCVAVANKMTRQLWAMLAKGENYKQSA